MTAAPPRPPTRYVSADGAAVAYQVVGDGPRDIVFVPGMLSHVELWWEQPAFAETFLRIASMARLILYDRRGTGLSEGEAVPTLDERIADLAAVMGAAGSDRAVIFGPSDGAATALLFAVTHPGRCSHLILYGAQATGLRDDEYPWGVTEEELELVLRSIKYEWGRGGTLALQAPTLSGNESMVEWWSRFERLGIREGQLIPSLRAMAMTDVRDLLPLVSVPTLVSH
jgi:pimeloyl-ACP methyl ester carboxylesterase